MRLKIIWCKDYSGTYRWTCRYGNIITRSAIHPQRCFDIQIKKLKARGIDMSRIENCYDVIDPDMKGAYNEYGRSNYNAQIHRKGCGYYATVQK